MPSGTVGGHQMPQSTANVSAVGIPGYASGTRVSNYTSLHQILKKNFTRWTHTQQYTIFNNS